MGVGDKDTGKEGTGQGEETGLGLSKEAYISGGRASQAGGDSLGGGERICSF